MLNLSELAFKVNTDALVQAAEKIAALGKSVESLQGSFSKLEKGAAASEKALAEVNIKNAQAAKANAEAALLQAKTITEVEKAERAREKAIQSTTKATEEQTKSVSTSVSVLQRQSDIYGFMIEGFSKGQSSILATAKAAGIAAEEMKNLQDVLQAQRTIMGGDPFDKSLGSLKSLQNEFKVLKEVQRLYTAEIPLTRKQMENLALDKLRLVEAMKAQGKSFSEIKAELQKLNAEYIATAGGINRLIQAENQIDKAHKDTANANAYLEKEMQRVNYALQTQNNELNKGTANALFRFEQNLKRSGLTLAEQKKKLDDYRTSLLALEKSKGSTQTDYISRALGPQITDIFVGLATGQNPLTVMLQQGGQLRDQFALAGIAAEDMGNTMRTAARSMVTSVAAVASAFKDLLVGAFLDTGAAITDAVVKVSGFNTLVDKAKAKLAAGGEQNFKYIGTLTRMGEVFRVAVGASLAASTVALLAFGVAMVQVMKAQDAMTIALVSTGASLGITTNQATEMAKAVDRTGASFSGVLDIFAMIAEKGNISAESMQKITEAALKLEAVGGASVEKTVEQFSKLADDPVKALSEYTQATGLLTQAEIARIGTLVELGQETTAVKEATEMLSAAKQKESALIYAGLSPLSRIWLDIKNGIKEAWGVFQEFAGSSALVTVLKNALQVVAVIATEVWFAVKGIGESLGGLGAVAAAVMTDIKNLDTNFTSSKNVLGLIKETDEARKAAYKDAIDRIMQQGAYEQAELEKTAQAQAKVNKENSDAEKERLSYQAVMKPWKEAEQKGAKDLLTRQQFINKAIEDANKGLKEGTSLREKDVALIQKMAGLEWDKANKGNKPKKDPSENYYEALLRDSTNATIKADEATQDLTKSQLKMLEVINDPRFAKLSENQQTTVLRNYAVAASNERIVEGQELINKLLGKGEGLGKEYYATLAKLESLKGNAGIDQEQLEKALQALRDTTPEAKRVRDEIKAAAEAYNQYSANAIASLESTKIGNQQLDYRLSVLGKSTDEQRKMKIQQDASVKLMQAEVKYAKEVLKIRQDTKLQNDPMLMAKALQDAEAAYAEERKLINREVAVEAAEDFQKEFDRISGGVTDSIVTALFEGGKAGSKKIRNLVVAELKKPVTMVVNAVVNTLLGGVMNSFTASMMGGGGGLLGSISSLSGLVSTANNLYSAITGGFANLSGSIATQVQSGLNFLTGSGGMISQGPIQVGGLAQGIGSVAAPLLGAYGGISAGRLIGGGYSLNGGSGNSTINLGTAVGSLFGPLGALAGGAIGGTVNRLFGRKLKESGIEGTFGGETGFEGRTYQYYKGGLFRSNKTTYGTLDEETRSNFAKSFFDMKDGVSEMSKMLGLGTESLEDFTYKFKVNLKGLSEEEATKAIQEQFKLMGEEMAKLVLETDKYSLAEETRMDTLIRLSSTLSTVNTIFENMGMTMYDISLTGADAAYELSQLFGGLEQFTSVMSNYHQNFYSAEEQRANVQKQLAKYFKELGLSMIDIDATDARQQFRDLVEAQDLTTESGRKAYAALLAIAGTFASVTITAEEASAAAADAAADLKQAWKDAASAAYDVLEKAIQAQINILNEQAKASEATISKLKGIFDLLKSSISDLYGEVASTAAMQSNQGYQVIQDAISTGVLPDQAKLGSAISAVRTGINNTNFTTQFEADKSRLQLAADLNTLLGQTEQQLSTEELTLKAIKDQIAMLELTLANAKAQLDAINGVNTSVLSVADAIREFQNALIPPTTTNLKEPPKVPSEGGGFSSGPSGPNDSPSRPYDPIADIKDLYNQTLDPTTLRLNMYLRGWTVEQMAEAAGVTVDFARGHLYKDVPAFANGGAYQGGLALVGEEGPELINFNQGGRVFNAGDTAAALSGGMDTVSAVQSLETRVDNLNYALQAIAINTSKTARVLERVTPDGDSILITDSATL